MTLPPFLKRKKSASSDAGDPALESAAVQEARTRARRRLIGAVVLLAIGVIVFPLLFESQPRPLASDVAVELARKVGSTVATANVATARPARAMAPPTVAPSSAQTSAPVEASQEAAAAPPASPAPTAPTASTAEAQPAPPPIQATPVSSAPATSGRFVVQVGAFTDAAAMREARQKVEKLGLKTYTQIIETTSGKRTRVRVGPFDTRDEADRAGTLLKGAGMPAYILVM